MTLLLGTFTALFSVVNPLGAMPVFVSLTQRADRKYGNLMARKAAIIMAGILIVFFLAGTYIMDFFGISLDHMRVAGGLIIIRSAYGLLSARFEQTRTVGKKVQEEAMHKDDISFSPIAMPMLSGPGSIALLIGLRDNTSDYPDYGIIIGAIMLVALTSYLILRISPMLVDKLGQSGINAMSRMLGFIVLAIGIQYIANGVGAMLKEILEKGLA